MRLLLTTFLIIATMAISVGNGHSKSVLKKINKGISREFCGEEITREAICFTENQKELFSGKVEDNSLFRLMKGEESVGFLILASSKGRFELFDYLVIYDTEFAVKRIEILTYRSNRGMAVTNRKWLMQYSGYKGGELNYGKDIQAISGATLSAQSLTHDIKILTETLKKSGL